MNTATLIYHTSTQRISSTATMRGMQQSSISAVKPQSTPVTIPSEELTSISSQSFDTPTPPTLASSAIQGSGEFLWLHDGYVTIQYCDVKYMIFMYMVTVTLIIIFAH